LSIVAFGTREIDNNNRAIHLYIVVITYDKTCGILFSPPLTSQQLSVTGREKGKGSVGDSERSELSNSSSSPYFP
jgi:hypothetical protein